MLLRHEILDTRRKHHQLFNVPITKGFSHAL
jgi:hypothetical protein